MTNLAADASQMLAAALEQMDDIIAGTKLQTMDYENGPVLHNQVNIHHTQPVGNGTNSDLPRLVDELRWAAERAIENGEDNQLRERVEESTKQYLIRWFQGKDHKDITSDAVAGEKMKRLESDKHSLQLQVNILTEQVEVQNEKIQEMETVIAERSRKLSETEDRLLQESEIHCELEQSQQNYAMEASQLRARLDAVENETLVVRERAIQAEGIIEEKQQDINQLVAKFQQSQKSISELQSECHTWQEKYMESQALLDDLQAKQVRSIDEELEKEKLKIAIDSLITANKEKDKTMEEMNRRLSRFHKVQEMAAAQGRVDVGLLLDIENPRTDSVSTSSSATGETDSSREGRPAPQGSSPMSPEHEYKHAMMEDRTEAMFGSMNSRRATSLENLKTVPMPSGNDPSSDSTHPNNDLDPTPDTSCTEPETNDITPAENLPDTDDKAADELNQPDKTLPEEMLQLTKEIPELATSAPPKTPPFPVPSELSLEVLAAHKTPPFPVPSEPSMEVLAAHNTPFPVPTEPSVEASAAHKTPPFPVPSEPSMEASAPLKTPPFPLPSEPSTETVRKVNFNLDATTEIGVDQEQNFHVSDDEEHPLEMPNGQNLTNGHSEMSESDPSLHENGSFDPMSHPKLLETADLTDIPSDVDLTLGHRTLPAPKKSGDPEADLSVGPNPSGYRTLPSPRSNREFHIPSQQPASSVHGSPDNRKPRASFGKGLFKKGSKKTSSAPNLAMTESEGEDVLGVQRPRNVTFQSLERSGYPAPPGTPPLDYRRRKGGIKKLIGKLRRSGSASFTNEDEEEDVQVEFTRNSRLRATAGPRLAWSRELKKNTSSDVNTPFAKWDGDQVAEWIREMGLAQYAAACRVWVKNGGTLLGASPLELEKYLGLKNPLHRKKLQLALQAKGSEQDDHPGNLDYQWATRWLDDVGLPQYKDGFVEAKIDGRMLHYMTLDDLLLLKVTSAFHHVSIMRGIQCLRLNNFHPNCLRRRPTDEPYETGTQVMLWTNHRVMEWLRSVDLSEYAPNLRGSGVHGALMVLEPRFTAETLASILCIPGNKTLLRRHLSTHFISLIGPEIQQQKRDAEKQPTFVPLNFLAKVKPKKRTFGNRKRGGEMDDYICPMELGHPASMNGSGHLNGSQPAPPSYRVEVRSADMVHRQRDENGDGVEMQEGAATKFGAVSDEINSLTTMLKSTDLDRSTHV